MWVAVSYVTVSAKIPRRIKELLDRYGIKVGPVIKRALEEEVKRKIIEEVEEEARELSVKVSHIPCLLYTSPSPRD